MNVPIEANYYGQGVWLPARLVKQRPDGTVEVMYEDGEKEMGVSLDKIRSPAPQKTPAKSTPSDVKIEANYHGTGCWLPATLLKERVNGTVDVQYIAGDRETEHGISVDKIRIRKPTTTEPKQKREEPASYAIGTSVEGNYRGMNVWFPGTIKRVRGDGTYDVKYDDGEVEARVDSKMIKKSKQKSAALNSKNPTKPPSPKSSSPPSSLRRYYSADKLPASSPERTKPTPPSGNKPNTGSGSKGNSSTSKGKGESNTTGRIIGTASYDRHDVLVNTSDTGSITISATELQALKAILKSRNMEITALREKLKKKNSFPPTKSKTDDLKDRQIQELSIEVRQLGQANQELAQAVKVLSAQFADMLRDVTSHKAAEGKFAKQIRSQSALLSQLQRNMDDGNDTR